LIFQQGFAQLLFNFTFAGYGVLPAIKPDNFDDFINGIVYPTKQGIYHNRDEVLEKALQIAGCQLSIPAIKESKSFVDVYPNPASTQVTFKMNSGDGKKVTHTIRIIPIRYL
jgi:hypothetical protein